MNLSGEGRGEARGVNASVHSWNYDSHDSLFPLSLDCLFRLMLDYIELTYAAFAKACLIIRQTANLKHILCDRNKTSDREMFYLYEL